MGLATYRKKRSFSKTPEPTGGKPGDNALHFVIQKHDASHLHYDFRLEMEAVLKSWAVPKGPSTDPSIKRLAMMVEDHPYDYKNFEGIIPKGQYGGGTVIVWDEGTYEPADAEFANKKEKDKYLRSQLHKGKLHIIMHGKKMKGEYGLVKTFRDEKSWLLFKVKDKYAKETDILKKDKSVISGKSIAQMEKSPDRIYGQKKNGQLKVKPQPRGRKSKMPAGLTPMNINGIRKSLVNPADKEQVKKVGGRELKLTNLDKIYWPKEKIRKGDMINYYYQVAPFMLPFMKDRPQSLNRYPNGINGESFYQKNIAGKMPDWIKTHDYANKTTEGNKKFMVCSDEASLIYMANLGCIEMNPWHSRIKSPDKPDWSVIDLDPDKQTFDQVIEVANVVHQVLESAGIPSYPKTSGSTGIHIYIPLGAKYSYEQSKVLAQVIVSLVQRELPDFTTLERTPSKRKGKMYLDFLQNRSIQTIAAPYSLRPKPGAPVSMPLEWDEVKKGLKPGDFTIHNAVGRIKETKDLFKPVLGKGIELETVLKKLEKLL